MKKEPFKNSNTSDEESDCKEPLPVISDNGMVETIDLVPLESVDYLIDDVMNENSEALSYLQDR